MVPAAMPVTIHHLSNYVIDPGDSNSDPSPSESPIHLFQSVSLPPPPPAAPSEIRFQLMTGRCESAIAVEGEYTFI